MERHRQWAIYLPGSPLLRDSGLCCHGVGEQCGPQQPMRPRRLSSHALVFVTDGSGSYTGSPYPAPRRVVAPAVLWLFPGVGHAYGPGRGGWTEHWILFEGSATRAYESLAGWRRREPVVDDATGLAEQVAPFFQRLRQQLAVPGRSAELLGATAAHALIGIAAGYANRQPLAGSDRPTAVEAVIGSAFGPAPVAKRARAAGLSPDALRREVRRQTGLSVHELVLQTRLGRAQSLLATTSMAIATVARQVGYDDPAYFSRLFRSRIGMPPSDFRIQQGR